MLNIKPHTLQWAGGTFCAMIGALMLIAPHQFGSPTYLTLQPHLPSWGALFLLTGAALIGTAALAPQQLFAVAVHVCTGSALLLLAWGFLVIGALSGTAVYSVIGVGIFSAPLLLRQAPGRVRRQRDLFTLLMSLAAVLVGLLILVAPAQFSSPLYGAIRLTLPWYGGALLLSGLLLGASQLHPAPPRWGVRVAHLLVAGVFWLWMIASSLPTRAWTGIAFYGGFGALLALLPWVESYLYRLEPRSLQTRFALAFVSIAALPLIAATALVTNRQERAVTGQALAAQEALARALAQDTANVLELHRATLTALAAHAGLLTMTAEEQRTFLAPFQAAYPNVYTFATFDAAGNALARSDDRPLTAAAGFAVFEGAQRDNEASLDVVTSPTLGRPVFALGEPIRDPEGGFAGLVVALLEATRVADLLARAGGAGVEVSLIAGDGRVLAHSDASLVAATDLSRSPVVTALLSGESGNGEVGNENEDVGSLSYQTPAGVQLAAYARVPGLAWGVVVERPRAAALAATRAAQDLTFGLLWLGIGTAAVVGVLLARGLAAPLGVLARAAASVAADEGADEAANEGMVTLPSSHISEVAHLASVFGSMRERLAQRTAERAQAEGALRESEERYRVVAETASDAIITIDEASTILFVNPAAEKIFGHHADAMLHQPLTMLMPEYLRHIHQAGLGRYLETGQRHLSWEALELPGLHESGQEIPLEVSFGEFVRGDTRYFTSIIRDITERKRVAEQLKQEKDFSDATINSLPGIFYLFDIQGRFLRWNTRIEEISHYSAAEIADLHPLAFFTDDEKPVIAETIQEVFAKGAASVEGHLLTKGGEKIPYLFTGSRLFIAGEAYLVGVGVDTTERKLAEEALQKEQEFLKAMLDNITDGIVACDARGILTSFNQAAQEFHGLPAHSIPADQWPDCYDLYLADGKTKMSKGEIPLFRALQGERVRGSEMVIAPKEGHARHLVANGQALFSAHGERLGAVIAMHDITERKRTEEARAQLLELEQAARLEAEAATLRLRFLAEASTLLASSLDYETTLTNVATLAVPTMADWCAVDFFIEDGALQRVALVHKDPTKVSLGRDLQHRYPSRPGAAHGIMKLWQTGQAELYSNISDAMLKGVAYDAEHLAVLQQLGLRSALLVPLRTREGLFGAITLALAESDRRYGPTDLALAEELALRAAVAIENARLYQEAQTLNEVLESRVAERTAALEAANKELEAFSYSVSHDLRAPLRGVSGFSQMLLEGYATALDDTARGYVLRIRAATQRMEALIDGLLQLARLSQGEMRQSRVNLSSVAKTIADELKTHHPERRVRFIIAEDLVVEGDERLLAVVLENLLGNAWKFTAKQPHATIEVGVLHDVDDSGETHYFVRDNGAGFDMRYVGKLFGTFQRLHAAAEFEGTGIGLATVRRIIERQGGRIWAEAEVGKGATFRFTLATPRGGNRDKRQ